MRPSSGRPTEALRGQGVDEGRRAHRDGGGGVVLDALLEHDGWVGAEATIGRRVEIGDRADGGVQQLAAVARGRGVNQLSSRCTWGTACGTG